MKLNIKKLEHHYSRPSYEGRFGHMYLDSEGHVTIGVGHLIYKRLSSPQCERKLITSVNDKTRLKLSKVNFLIDIEYKAPNAPPVTRKPNQKELEYAFMKVASCGPCYLGRAYRKFADLAYKTNIMDWPDYTKAQIYITEEEISRIFYNDIKDALMELKKYPYLKGNKFDSLPMPAQEALVDMMFNLGADQYRGFREFRKAIEKEDYLKAAQESKRIGVQLVRNKYVKDLLKKAAAEIAAKRSKSLRR